ncbi:hypothetical protein MOQ_002390, partial [Trypanosoma cruzi marinkellei]
AGGEEVAPDAPTGNGVISPNDTAGAPQEAEKKSDLPCNDDVADDGVTSVVGQPAGDEAASDRTGGGATTAGPKGSDAADAAPCAVDPPRSDADAAVGRGDWEADVTDAPPPIHGNNATAAVSVPVRRRGTTVLGGGMDSVARRGDCGCFLRGPHSAVVAQWKQSLPIDMPSYMHAPCALCLTLCVVLEYFRCTVLLLCCLLMQRHHTALFHCFSFCLVF